MSKISNKQVTRAGEYFIKNLEGDYDYQSDDFKKSIDAVEYWRQVHQEALEPAFTKLELLVYKIDKKAICAKRLKRLATIIIKLYRFKNQRMTLRNMQDIGGCRAILSSNKKLKQAIRQIKKEPQFKNKSSKKFIRINNYIKHPKPNGYRSYHIVGQYPDQNNILRKIEIQLRSPIQHSWATAVEITDLFNNQSLKNNDGDPQWSNFFLLCSKMFEHIEDIYEFENTEVANIEISKLKNIIKSKLNQNQESEVLLSQLKTLYRRLKVHKKLSGYMKSIESSNEEINIQDNISGYVLFKINIRTYTTSKKYYTNDQNELANSEYSIAETYADDDTFVSLIYTRNLKDLKSAYPNYFADSELFLKLMDLIINIK